MAIVYTFMFENVLGPELIIFVGFLYGYICVDAVYRGDNWTGLVYFSYALANIGLYKLAIASGANFHH